MVPGPSPSETRRIRDGDRRHPVVVEDPARAGGVGDPGVGGSRQVQSERLVGLARRVAVDRDVHDLCRLVRVERHDSRRRLVVDAGRCVAEARQVADRHGVGDRAGEADLEGGDGLAAVAFVDGDVGDDDRGRIGVEIRGDDEETLLDAREDHVAARKERVVVPVGVEVGQVVLGIEVEEPRPRRGTPAETPLVSMIRSPAR